MMMPPCSQPLGEREDLTETMPPVALRSLVDSGSRQDDQFGRMVRTTARRPARCGKPDPFRAQGKPRHWARVVAGGSGPPPLFGGGKGAPRRTLPRGPRPIPPLLFPGPRPPPLSWGAPLSGAASPLLLLS